MITFSECVVMCAGNQDLVQQFNRLTGFHMGEDRDALAQAIDKACGYDPDKEAFPAFIEFVDECVWTPLVGGGR